MINRTQGFPIAVAMVNVIHIIRQVVLLLLLIVELIICCYFCLW